MNVAPANCTKRGLGDVSVVIVTYKGDDLLRGCLDSLAGSCGRELQIVVVDNSPAETTRVLVALYANAFYVASPGNPGFAGGNNRAMPYCTRRYVLLLNNDTIVEDRSSIETLARCLDENPQCGVAGGTGVLPNVGNTLNGCGAYLSPLGNIWSYGMFTKDAPEENRERVCFAVGGYFLMFRRELLPLTHGLFQPDFWCYYEEIDFCHRVWLAGYEVRYIPTKPIIHLMNQTSKNFDWSFIMRKYLRNILFSLNANLSWPSRLWLSSAFSTLIIARSLAQLLRPGGRKMAKMQMLAFADYWRSRMRVKAARRRIQKSRRRSDFAIFARVMRLQPVSSFLKSI